MDLLSLIATAKIVAAGSVLLASSVIAGNQVSAQASIQADSGYAKDQCKQGGWKNMGFRNQGQCVSFFVSNNPNR